MCSVRCQHDVLIGDESTRLTNVWEELFKTCLNGNGTENVLLAKLLDHEVEEFISCDFIGVILIDGVG